MGIIQPAKIYNDQTLREATSWTTNDIEDVVAYQTAINSIQTICISDVDGSYVNTNSAVRQAQARGLAKAGKYSLAQACKDLEEKGLRGAVEQFLSLNEFFKGPYKTFDPYKAAASGLMHVYEDALQFTKSGIPTIAISNSSEQATRNKFKALGIEDVFVGIHAEFLDKKAKPNIYLAEKAIKALDNKGWYNPQQTIVHIGDQEYDIQFGHNIKEIHPNTISVHIDRGKPYEGTTTPDHVVKSYMELYEL